MASQWFAAAVLTLGLSANAAELLEFSPSGGQLEITQARAVFSEAMAPLGRGDAPPPFEVTCSRPGTGYWADERTWVYDLPAGYLAGEGCRFRPTTGLKSLAGTAVTAPEQAFHVAGPRPLQVWPGPDSTVDEDQAFVLRLNGPVTGESLAAHVRCEVRGVQEALPVQRLLGETRRTVLRAAQAASDFDGVDDERVEVLRCARPLPPKAALALVWDAGVTGPASAWSPSGPLNEAAQRLEYQVREPFSARLRCTRENARAGCNPLLPIELRFSAPVARADLERVILSGPQGRRFPREKEGAPYGDRVVFKPPFPAGSDLSLALPGDLRDDNGRPLVNAGRFPLSARVGELPPLVKFAGEFGVIERDLDGQPGGILPVTLRNLEPAAGGGARLRWLRLDKDEDILAWMKRLAEAERTWVDDKQREPRRDRLLGADLPGLVDQALPKPEGAKTFEVVGVPLKQPGYYVLEAESRRLGQALLGADEPMYVRAAALVTNLAVHFKWGPRSSLAWVTALNSGRPTAGALVAVRDCAGRLLAQGRSDAQGMALLPKGLPDPRAAEYGCPLLVSARLGDDLAFARSDWDQGIETWRFGLPDDWAREDRLAHTVLDRSLFRPGETVHMKHVLREKRLTGLGYARKNPATLEIQHVASGQRWFLPLTWKNGTALSQWRLPDAARRGDYSLRLVDQTVDPNATAGEMEWLPGLESGGFSVADFRVPLMKAELSPAVPQLVAAAEAAYDVRVGYQSGGPARELEAKLRAQLEPRHGVEFPDYPDYAFAQRPYGEAGPEEGQPLALAGETLRLDAGGAGRGRVSGVPDLRWPHQLRVELEYPDPSGEIQTVARTQAWWPAAVVLGISREDWVRAGREHVLKFQALDLNGKPAARVPVSARLTLNRSYGYRVRLAGGFYGYRDETRQEPLDVTCQGMTDGRGAFSCPVKVTGDGEIQVDAEARDPQGRLTRSHQSYWVAGGEETWFAQDNHDRMDLLPEKKRYQPGETARFQVRMPFRAATALVTVERDGILDARVVELSGKSPVVTLPIRPEWAPNVFVSVLALRGRVGDAAATALVDLGRPAFKLGIAGIQVGQAAHALEVRVTPERSDYQTRETVRLNLKVRTPDGRPAPAATDLALAVVDEGLLELAPNRSWELLPAMLAERGYAMRTFTAQMQVTGKRHYGRKALPPGGGGGRLPTRELFDTLVYWNPDVTLDKNGEAQLEFPLNDSLTAFRVVAVAAGMDRFGTGEARIRAGRDLRLDAGLPPLARSGDRYQATFTLRNGTQRAMKARVEAQVDALKPPLEARYVALEPGEGKEIAWPVEVPAGVERLTWTVSARQTDGRAADSLKVVQRVEPAVPSRVLSSQLYRLERPLELPLALPAEALPGSGEVRATLAATLGDGLTGLRAWMREYPHACLEQRASKAVSTRDRRAWDTLAQDLPGYLDEAGLAQFFPSMSRGSVALTAYLLAIADSAGYPLPPDARGRMQRALGQYLDGQLEGGQGLAVDAQTGLRLAALEALARYGQASPERLATLRPEPRLWPTGALLDWIGILQRAVDLPERDARLREASTALRARFSYTGARLNLADEPREGRWWLMASADTSASRALLTALDLPDWRADIPKLVAGVLGRQRQGRWDTTTANAWGALALERHAALFESRRPGGKSRASLGSEAREVDWQRLPNGATARFPLSGAGQLKLSHEGAGAPYVSLALEAALPLDAPVERGYTLRRQVIPVEQKRPGQWSRGDIARVRLRISARDGMGWVVVEDPIPAGASLLGTGLKRDSAILVGDERQTGTVWPTWQERRHDAYRAYYEWLPRGEVQLEYTLRLNNPGRFQLPPTRVEAMYAPEMHGEAPNETWLVK